MPWTVDTVPAHVKKLSDKNRRRWAHIANGCLEDGKDEGVCIRMANGVVAKDKEVAPLFEDLDASLVASAEEVEVAEKSYQYVDSWEYESRLATPEQAGYSAAGGQTGKACSNCFNFISPARCAVVRGEIAPNGLSNLWRALPVRSEADDAIPVRIVDFAGVTKASYSLDALQDKLPVKAGAFKEPSVFTKVARSFADAVGIKHRGPTHGLLITKEASGRLRWYTRYSNAWEDKDGELLTEAAHKEYADWVNESKVYPELWLWHTKGTRFGQADWVDFADGFAHATGLIDDTPEALRVVEFLATQKDLGVSHGFLSVQKGKYVSKYRTFEISPLPATRAAAWATDFTVLEKETNMPFTAERRKWLVEAYGEDAVVAMEASNKSAGEHLKQLGFEYKEAGDPAAGEAAPNTDALADLGVGLKAIGQQVATLTGQVEQVIRAVAAVNTKAEKASTSLDEAVEKALTPRVSAALANAGHKPTAGDANVVGEEKLKELGAPAASEDDFLATLLKEQMGPILGTAAAVGAAVGPGTPAAAAVRVE